MAVVAAAVVVVVVAAVVEVEVEVEVAASGAVASDCQRWATVDSVAVVVRFRSATDSRLWLWSRPRSTATRPTR